MSARYQQQQHPQHSARSKVHEGLFSARSQDVLTALSQRSGRPEYNNPDFTQQLPTHDVHHLHEHTHLFDAVQPPSSRRTATGEPTPLPGNTPREPAFKVDDNDPLQLEHMIGYGGEYRKSLLAMPHEDFSYIKSLGCLVSIENVSDPHSQKFLRGHDMPVCSIAISPTGRLIASGQLGTKNYKGSASPIFLWNAHTCQRLGVLRGLAGGVSLMAFSTDEKFLCGCGEDLLLYIWDLATGEVVFGQRQPATITVLKWADHRKDNHNTAYELVIGMSSPNNALYQAHLTYDSMRMQWSMKTKLYTTPPTGGLIRNFYCVDLSMDRVFVYVGTSSGDMMVYRRDTVVFRAAIPVCTNGCQDLITLPNDSVVIGGGDGNFVRVVGHDMVWQKTNEFRLDSMVRSISLMAGQQELLVTCASGALYRANADDLTHSIVSVSTTSPISCLAFPPSTYPSPPSVFFFASGSQSGEIRVWDLTDYACISALKVPKAGAVLSLAMIDSDHIISGWQDGSVRCSDSNGKQLWSIPTAHRDGCLTIAVHSDSTLQYFVSGGGDGAIRVWKYVNRELITQYTEHRKGVAKVLVDVKSPNIVHSVGGDCSVLSYDLKAGRRIISHIVNNGNMTNMSQKKNGELETITCDSTGRLLFWDIDIREPVMAVQDPSRSTIRCVQVSPSGRFIAYAGDDQILKVLDGFTQQIVSLGQSHSGTILSLSWTPDEKQIISGGDDCCLSIWNFYIGGQA